MIYNEDYRDDVCQDIIYIFIPPNYHSGRIIRARSDQQIGQENEHLTCRWLPADEG